MNPQDTPEVKNDGGMTAATITDIYTGEQSLPDNLNGDLGELTPVPDSPAQAPEVKNDEVAEPARVQVSPRAMKRFNQNIKGAK